MRELVGYLDLLASNNPQRFVYASVDALREKCHRFNQPDAKYSKRWIEAALRELRARHVISARLMRWGMEGVIVAAHQHVVRVECGRCHFIGMAAPFDCWEQKIGPDGKPFGPVWWRKPADATAMLQHRASNAPATAGIPLVNAGKISNTSVHTSACTSVSTSVSTSVDTSVADSVQPDEKENTYAQNSVPNRVTGVVTSALPSQSTALTTQSVDSSQGKLVDETNSKSSVGVGVENKRLNDYSKTIGQHFGTEPRWPARVNIETMAAGQMMLDVWYEKVDEDVQHDLLSCCNEVIADMAAEPYRGLATNGMIMDLAAQRFRKKFGRFPKCWLKVLNDLKRAG